MVAKPWVGSVVCARLSRSMLNTIWLIFLLLALLVGGFTGRLPEMTKGAFETAKVAVMDITGVPAIDSAIANRLVQTVEAARLLGATVIVTGLSPEIAQTLVTIGVDLSKMNTVGDLQGGIELAERVLGYKVVLVEEGTPRSR